MDQSNIHPEKCLKIQLDSHSHLFASEPVTGQVLLQQTNFFGMIQRNAYKQDENTEGSAPTELDIRLVGEARLALPEHGESGERWSVNKVYEVSQHVPNYGLVPGSHGFWFFTLTPPDKSTLGKATHHRLEASVLVSAVTFTGTLPIRIRPFDRTIDTRPREQIHNYDAQLAAEHRHPSSRLTEKLERHIHPKTGPSYKFSAHSYMPREVVVGDTINAAFEIDPTCLNELGQKQVDAPGHPKIAVKGWTMEMSACEVASLPGLSGAGERLADNETVHFEERTLDVVIHGEDPNVKRVELDGGTVPEFLTPTSTCRHGAESYQCRAEVTLDIAGRTVKMHADEPVVVRPRLAEGEVPLAAVYEGAPGVEGRKEGKDEKVIDLTEESDTTSGTAGSSTEASSQQSWNDGETLPDQDWGKSASVFAEEVRKALDE